METNISKLYPFQSVSNTLYQIYGVDMNEEDVEEIGMHGWGHIGNKRTAMYRHSGCTEDCRLKLPCNVDIIEAVTSDEVDYITGENLQAYDYSNEIVEGNLDARQRVSSFYHTNGRLIDYVRISNDEIQLPRDYNNVNVLYKGVILDDTGLPELTEKEVNAIACYIAFVEMRKESYVTRERGAAELSMILEAEWKRRCEHARTPDYLNQNAMDKILRSKNSWDRKTFSISFKPTI